MLSIFGKLEQICIGITLSVGVFLGIYHKGWTIFWIMLAAVIVVNVVGKLLNARAGKFNWRYFIIPVGMVIVTAIGSFILSRQEAAANEYLAISDNLQKSNTDEVKTAVKAALSDGKLSHNEYLDLFELMFDSNQTFVIKMGQFENLSEEREKLIQAVDALK